MADVYSTLFFAVQGLVGLATYAVPYDKVAIVRDLDAYSAAILPAEIRLLDGITGQTIFFYDFSVGVDQIAQWRGRQVFNPSSSIQIEATNHPADIRVSGYLLNAP